LIVRLLNKIITVQNSTGNDIVLNIFHGAPNWWNTDNQEALDAIWDHPKSFGKPFTLAPPAINLDIQADAVLKDCTKQLEKLALEAAWPTITNKVYIQLFPNVIEDPATVIQNIH
jgi:hypothetical protein